MRSLAADADCGTSNDVVAEDITQKLEEDIIFGRLFPGQKLPEEDLSSRFGVSRHHVREALARLAATGIVVKERNRGVYVRTFSPEEVYAIYDVRELLQRHAALRIPLPASAADIQALTEACYAHKEAVEGGDLHSIRRTNDLFHDKLFSLCGNKILSDLISYYMDISFAIRANAFSREQQLIADREHALMIELLRTRDSWALSQLCVEHMQKSKEHYLAMLESSDAPQPERSEG